MRYFNGFCLNGEEVLFKDILIESNYVVAGFSYGAILAFEEAYKGDIRVDRLILISPAFFQNRKDRFLFLQILAWERDRDSYISTLLKNCSYPSDFKLESYLEVGTKEQLEYLLKYKWDSKKVSKLKKSGVEIEVFIGKEDKIVNVEALLDFFKDFATIYLFRDGGHILRGKKR